MGCVVGGGGGGGEGSIGWRWLKRKTLPILVEVRTKDKMHHDTATSHCRILYMKVAGRVNPKSSHQKEKNSFPFLCFISMWDDGCSLNFSGSHFIMSLFFVCLFGFCLFRAAPSAHGGSQARGQIGATAAGLHPQPQQHQIWAASVTYTTAHGNVRSLIHWARPGIEPTTSRFLVGFVSTAPQWECLIMYVVKSLCCIL